MSLHARTWSEVDLDAITHNLHVVRQVIGEGVGVMPVLKADAYGHGAVPLAWHLANQGVAALGVGDSTEALELRAAGITAPILVLGAVVPGELRDVLRGGIDVTVHSGDRVRRLRQEVRRTGARVRVHLKVDTGMGRLGCHPDRVLGIAREVRRSRNVALSGIATHLARTLPSGGRDAERQLRRFGTVLGKLEKEDLLPPWRHAHASGAILSRLPTRFNLVRPGLAIYGLDPHMRVRTPLRPALSWRTQIVFLKDHRKGAAIGYGGTWTCPRRSRIATLPVGYNDGYRFALSNKAQVLIRGQRCPVVGRVSMDYITVDVTHVPHASVNDVVTLLGAAPQGPVPKSRASASPDGKDTRLRVEELARWAGTIPHDLICGIGRRVKRQYIGGPSRGERPSDADGPRA